MCLWYGAGKVKAYQMMRAIARWLYGESRGTPNKILGVLILALSQILSVVQKMTYSLSIFMMAVIFPYFTKPPFRIKSLTFSDPCICTVKP